MSVDAVVIGGGPAGSACARLLASWGHRVLVLTRPADRSRGLAESLPPSTHKLLAEIGVLDDVERAGFYRSTGNTVFWASRDPRIESFDGLGFQVFRPDFDRVLLDAATRAGAEVREDVVVRADQHSSFDARIVLDCSGRAGVIGRRVRVPQPGHRTVALVGVWRRDDAWPLPDPSHTVVETFDDGWAWSVPTSRGVRHVGMMVGSSTTYERALDMTSAMRALVAGAALDRTFARDASLYRPQRYAGPDFLLVGDAGSFIDPLSSFGVKKALASAWIASIAAHTCLIDAGRRAAAIEFFDDWERRVYDDHLRRSREFARAAAEAHPGPFWTSRAEVDLADVDALDAPDVRAAFERIRDAEEIDFALADEVHVEPRPVIRGREIVLEPSFPVRFFNDVDLVRLAEIACRHRRVPDVYDAYCRALSSTPLPNVVSGLSLLVANGILTAKT